MDALGDALLALIVCGAVAALVLAAISLGFGLGALIWLVLA